MKSIGKEVRCYLVSITIFLTFQSVLCQPNSADITLRVTYPDSQDALIDDITSATLFIVQEGLFDTLRHLKNPSNPLVFEEVPFEDYLIAIEHKDPFYWLPTYYGDAVEWVEADTLKLLSDTSIQIQKYELGVVDLGGVGVIDLTIKEGFDDILRRGKARNCLLKRRRLDDDSFDPFEPISFGRTDSNGQYQWLNIPEGTYKLTVEYPGLLQTQFQFEIDNDACLPQKELIAFVQSEGIEIDFPIIDFIYDPCLGEIDPFQNPIFIHPNPATNHLFVQSTMSIDQVSIYNSVGQMIWKGSFTETKSIDISDFKPGVYYIQIGDGNQSVYSRKFIKQ